MGRQAATAASTLDRRAIRTRQALRQALVDLVRDRDLSDISVADVADAADVNRSTFYDHYRDTSDLAAAASSAMIDELVESLPSLRPGSPTAAAQAATSLEMFFESVRSHQRLYRGLLGPHGSAHAVDHLRRRLRDTIAEATAHAANTTSSCQPSKPGTEDVWAAYASGALFGVAVDWVTRGCPTTPVAMSEAVWPLLSAHGEI